MRIIFLGTGSAFTTDPDNFQSNMLLEGQRDPDSGRVPRLLIDCGSDARRALAARGLTHLDLDGVYISHLHADHAGGLEWLGFVTYFDKRAKRLPLYMAEPMVRPLWDHMLKAGMDLLDKGRAVLEDYFEVRPLPPEGSFTFGSANLTLRPNPHIVVEGEDGMLSYGLLIEQAGQTVYLTTDSVPDAERQMPFYQRADAIFHDCELTRLPSGAHSHYTYLRELPPEVKAKMWLYHVQDGPLPDARAEGFRGFVMPGQSFELGMAPW